MPNRHAEYIGGRSIWGSGVIAPHRYLTVEMRDKSSGNTILVMNDDMDVSSTLRSCGFAVRIVAQNDLHSRHEVLASITEGTIVGFIVGLMGPRSAAYDLNTSRSRDADKLVRPKDHQTRSVAREHAYLAELMMLVQSCGGFLLLTGASQSKIWQFTFVRSLLETREFGFHVFDVNTCWVKDYNSSTCYGLRIATTLTVQDTSKFSQHASSCLRSVSRQAFRQATKTIAETDEADKLKSLGKALARQVLVPAIHTIVTDRLSRLERYPEPGEDDQTEQSPDGVSRMSPERSLAAPTAQAQKYKESLKASGRTPKKRARPTPEQHYDDCGEDVSSIAHVSMVEECYRDTVYFEDELHDVFMPSEDNDFNLSNVTSFLGVGVPDAIPVVDSFAALFERQSILHDRNADKHYVDVAEVMGGEARTTSVMVRRNYLGGLNFDCVVGVDLMNPADEHDLYVYLRKSKPFVLVMAPQCTGMAGWGRLNAVVNPVTHAKSVSVSHHLGRICAHCAWIQWQGNRHWFTEQPKGSDLYQLEEWQIIARETNVTWCNVHMCMVGLRSTRNIPLKKPSELWASDEQLLWRFRPKVCDGSHDHDTIEGGESKPSQVWTWTFARILADGIEDLIRYRVHFAIADGSFPVAGRPGLPPSVSVDQVDPNHPFHKWKCRACRNGIEKTNPRHTRVPDECKWPLVEEQRWSCPGCRTRQKSASDQHTFQPGDCRYADPALRGRSRPTGRSTRTTGACFCSTWCRIT